jgi:DNA-binding NarL/FixJ family response regulator
MAIHVLIADDHPIVRSGVRTELQRRGGFSVVGEALDGDQALQLTRQLLPDVLLLDINMPGLKAVKVLQALKEQDLPVRVLVLTAYGDLGTVLGMFKAGADGYILKDEDPSVIPEAIRSVFKGEVWFSPSLDPNVITLVRQKQGSLVGDTLTAREEQVLQLLVQGSANKEIAFELQTSERTVEFHVTNILEKLGVKSRLEAALWAKEHGIV